jgi:hypothetical protein
VRLAELEAAVFARLAERYPTLAASRDEQGLLVSGWFPVADTDGEVDRFLVEIRFPGGIGAIPRIYETGGRIPRIGDRHVFTDGSICAEVPEVTLARGDYDLIAYLDAPVRNYFLGQAFVEEGLPWPFGELRHNKPGLLQAYGDLLGVSGEARIRAYLDCLTHDTIKGHWPCPCGSGKTLRRCHLDNLRALQPKVGSKVAKSAIAHLNAYDRAEHSWPAASSPRRPAVPTSPPRPLRHLDRLVNEHHVPDGSCESGRSSAVAHCECSAGSASNSGKVCCPPSHSRHRSG